MEEILLIDKNNNKEYKEGETFTITFGNQAENHVGMEKMGEDLEKGLSLKNLENIKNFFEKYDYICELIDLKELLDEDLLDKGENVCASVLIIRRGSILLLENKFRDLKNFYEEIKNKEIDKKAFMRGKVVNKHARWNVCFGYKNQNPDFENKKGTIYNFEDMNYLNKIKNNLQLLLKEENFDFKLYGELNHYYDINKTGIGFHGDGERKIAIGIRLGDTIPLHYQWYKNSERIGKRKIIDLYHGDIYFMGDKAVGYDWMKSSKLTLRHAAGCDKYTK